MAPFQVCLFALLAFLALSGVASAEIVEHSFRIKNLTVERLCERQVITAVNGSLPGPTIRVKEGDTLVVHLLNESPYNMTLHWHGVFQKLTPWYDGPEFVTQCAVRPGHSYTYRFNITGQEGTLWWHAHVKWHRATVYGALIIRPPPGRTYPFPKPYREVPILLGEWWNANVIDVENQALSLGTPFNVSHAYTINGQPGDLFPCSSPKTYKLEVIKGKTYLLRIINAALSNQLFFKIANHRMTVVAVDASYTDPYDTDIVIIAPGQTTDVLLTADQSPSSYYMVATPYSSNPSVLFGNVSSTGIISYQGSTSSNPILPNLPAFNDTPTAHQFYSNLTGLVTGPFWVPVPTEVDYKMFVTVGLGLAPCLSGFCLGPTGPSTRAFAASMNNESFVLPTTISLLEAYYNKVDGIYTTDFPNQPPLIFDYTNPGNFLNESIVNTQRSTRMTKLKFNTTVEMVMQNTAMLGTENHPMHMHGFNFHVLAQGFGNYDSVNDPKKFNFVNPQERNTIAVPKGGWAVIRFRANNPGVWLIHCHLDTHLPWGLSTGFVVENGGTPSSTLPPPPQDLPKC